MAQDSIHWIRAFFSTNTSSSANFWQPHADIYRIRTGWLIKYDLAGVLPEDVNLTFDGLHLNLRGIRRDCCLEEGCCHYCMEISYSHFARTIELPELIEQARLSTEYRRGMLLVRIEKEAR